MYAAKIDDEPLGLARSKEVIWVRVWEQGNSIIRSYEEFKKWKYERFNQIVNLIIDFVGFFSIISKNEDAQKLRLKIGK